MKKTQPTEFGKEIKAQLAKLGKTQRQFAQEIGIHETYLSFILNGRVSGEKYKNEIIKRLNLDFIAFEKIVYSTIYSKKREIRETQRDKRPLTEFGKEVKIQLLKQGKTQKQLAQEVGIDEVYLTIVLHGKRSGEKYKNEIARRLNIDLNVLDKREFDIANDESRYTP